MDNLGFIIAGYTLTWATLLWYAWRTNKRIDTAVRGLAALERTEPNDN